MAASLRQGCVVPTPFPKFLASFPDQTPPSFVVPKDAAPASFGPPPCGPLAACPAPAEARAAGVFGH